MAKGMHRPDVFETFRRQRFAEILFADTRDAVSGKFLASLTDEETLPVWGLWGDSVFLDIERQELRCFSFERYDPKAVPFTQDGEGIFPGVEVVES